MILLDTSVWVEHFRNRASAAAAVLEKGAVLVHPYVVGELACGNLARRAEVLALLRSLPNVTVATDDEVLAFIDSRQIAGRGIGYIDAHLLASAFLENTRLWTLDPRLAEVATQLGVAHH